MLFGFSGRFGKNEEPGISKRVDPQFRKTISGQVCIFMWDNLISKLPDAEPTAPDYEAPTAGTDQEHSAKGK